MTQADHGLCAGQAGPYEPDVEELAGRLQAGDARALARGISWVENDPARARELLARVYGRVGRARRLGMTGPPGAGKSTLLAAVIERLRAGSPMAASVGVVAVDPTSPFSGGAVLGDRVRMAAVVEDPAVFIRSMATRGRLGGLAPATSDAADLMDAAGKDWVFIETVGVGQTEIDVAAAVPTTVVVLSPESGDAIQAMKAGLLEVADIFVVNKADRPEADALVRELEQLVMASAPAGRVMASAPAGRVVAQVAHTEESWLPPVLKTVARKGEGVDELLAATDRHWAWLGQGERLRAQRERQYRGKIRDLVLGAVAERYLGERGALLDDAARRAAAGELSPYGAAEELLKKASNGSGT